jgi:PAS domain S-box-containing protein
MGILKNDSQSTCEVISIVTRTGTVLHASPSTASVFGYFPEEIVGRNAFDLVHPDDRIRLRRVAGAVLTGSRTRCLRLRARRKDGEWRLVDATIYKLPNEYRFGTILVKSQEIHARGDGDESGEREMDELLSSNARLEHFASAVAHDLREPLRTISIFTELLIQESKLDAHGELLAQFIARGVARMSELFEGLHSFALDGLDRSSQSVDLARVAAEVLQDLKHAITKSNARVTVDPLPFVQGNKVLLARILQNLIVNAIKYRSEMPVRIRIGAERLGPKWIVRIKDNGIGIPPEHHEQVFGLFSRLHGTEIPGSGIGLAICRKIVESSGDTIWVEPGTSPGTTFCFTIGAIPEEAGSGSSFENRASIAAGACFR